MTDLTSLKERIETAEEGSRELDADIALALLDAQQERNYWLWQSSRPQGSDHKPVRDYWRSRDLRYTASVDAALALVERLGLDPRIILVAAGSLAEYWERKGKGAFVGILPRAIIYQSLTALTQDHGDENVG